MRIASCLMPSSVSYALLPIGAQLTFTWGVCCVSMLGFCSRGVRHGPPINGSPTHEIYRGASSQYLQHVLVSLFVTKVSLVVGSRRELPGWWLSPATLQHRVLNTS